MATQSPSPFPTDGQRKLSPAEQARRAKALACTMPKDNRPSCSGQVFVGIFFDGTGNNLHDDYEVPPPEKRKHSNVVRLFHTFPFDKPGHFRYYIPGVGTPFPQIGDDNKYIGPNRGAAGGEKGEDRIIWAFTRLINAPHQFVTQSALIPDAQAKTITLNVASVKDPTFMRRVVLNHWQDTLKSALEGKKPFVEQINLSVFGFSRGAAEARVFVNWLFEVCKQENGGWTFAGIPIRLQFLGIFDTVASVGAANLYENEMTVGHQGWADNTLEIHPAVEQCVHYVAGHEIRACFPLDSVRVKSTYPANAKEVMYPGSHSDVGGGYAPNDLGVSPKQDSFMSIIPGVNMYHEARKAGVPLLAWDELGPIIKTALIPSDTVINDFNAYIKAAKIGSGPVENLGHKHMSLYFSYRFKYVNSWDYFKTPPYEQASTRDKGYLFTTQSTLYRNLENLRQSMAQSEPKFYETWAFNRRYGQYLDKAKGSWAEMRATPTFSDKLSLNLKRAASGTATKTPNDHAMEVAQSIDVESVTPDMERFFDRYIHDSMAGFINMEMNEFEWNKIGFVKFRTVFKGND
jgi:hypothetical protein